MKTKYGIWCEVWGGVTGRRTAWLKTGIPETPHLFSSREDAEIMAQQLNNWIRRNSKASFHYSAREYRP